MSLPKNSFIHSYIYYIHYHITRYYIRYLHICLCTYISHTLSYNHITIYPFITSLHMHLHINTTRIPIYIRLMYALHTSNIHILNTYIPYTLFIIIPFYFIYYLIRIYVFILYIHIFHCTVYRNSLHIIMHT